MLQHYCHEYGWSDEYVLWEIPLSRLVALYTQYSYSTDKSKCIPLSTRQQIKDIREYEQTTGKRVL